MAKRPKLATIYPPRGMRAERAAAYLDMSETSFLMLVSLGEIAPGSVVKGMVIWDRDDLDVALENWKAKGREKRRNTFDEALDAAEAKHKIP